MPNSLSSRLLAAVLALAAVSGCKHEQKPAATAAASSEMSSDTVVATYGDGQKVTWGDLNNRTAGEVHNARKEALDQLITSRLVEDAAKKKGVTKEEFIKQEVDSKVTTPPEDQMKQIFEGAKAQGRGLSLVGDEDEAERRAG